MKRITGGAAKNTASWAQYRKTLCHTLYWLGCVVFAHSAFAAEPRSGITLHSTRVIYPQSAQGGVTLSLTNNAETAYLVQSWIRPWDNQDSAVKVASPAPFLVTPPLQRLSGKETLALRIRLTRNELPTDRESLFALMVKAIPSQSVNEASIQGNAVSGARLVLAVETHLKLFYRPEGLKAEAIRDIAAQLHFQRAGAVLKVRNPTPYYVTFDALSVGDSAITPPSLYAMVPPFGEQTYPLPSNSASAHRVSWQLIDEFGSATAKLTQALTP
ncbi:molecular chaperone [Providencia rettgeri]|nr:molecular chaperone [Providencia rettgeri]